MKKSLVILLIFISCTTENDDCSHHYEPIISDLNITKISYPYLIYDCFYEIDSNNRIVKSKFDNSTGVKNYHYNSCNQLIKITLDDDPDYSTQEFKYYADGTIKEYRWGTGGGLTQKIEIIDDEHLILKSYTDWDSSSQSHITLFQEMELTFDDFGNFITDGYNTIQYDNDYSIQKAIDYEGLVCADFEYSDILKNPFHLIFTNTYSGRKNLFIAIMTTPNFIDMCNWGEYYIIARGFSPKMLVENRPSWSIEITEVVQNYPVEFSIICDIPNASGRWDYSIEYN